MTLPRCLFLSARNAVEAVNYLTPRLSSVLRESSRKVCLFCFFEVNFEVFECAKWISRVLVIFIKPFSKRTEDGMFGHPTRDAFALVSSHSRSLNNHTNSCVVTRYGPLPQILKNMGVSVEVASLSHRNIDEG